METLDIDLVIYDRIRAISKLVGSGEKVPDELIEELGEAIKTRNKVLDKDE